MSAVYVQCAGCGGEAPAVRTSENWAPPPDWFILIPSCCAKFEIYVCSDRCLHVAGDVLLDQHDVGATLCVQQTVRV